MNQTKRCLTDFKNVKFYRVIPKDWFKPKDLEFKGDLSTHTIEEFLEKFNLQIKI